MGTSKPPWSSSWHAYSKFHQPAGESVQLILGFSKIFAVHRRPSTLVQQNWLMRADSDVRLCVPSHAERYIIGTSRLSGYRAVEATLICKGKGEDEVCLVMMEMLSFPSSTWRPPRKINVVGFGNIFEPSRLEMWRFECANFVFRLYRSRSTVQVLKIFSPSRFLLLIPGYTIFKLDSFSTKDVKGATDSQVDTALAEALDRLKIIETSPSPGICDW